MLPTVEQEKNQDAARDLSQRYLAFRSAEQEMGAGR
jgi:hypothetical protein